MKISFDLFVNANPAAHQNILEVSGLVSLYVTPSGALDVHFGGRIYGSYPLTMGSLQRLEITQFLVMNKVTLRILLKPLSYGNQEKSLLGL